MNSRIFGLALVVAALLITGCGQAAVPASPEAAGSATAALQASPAPDITPIAATPTIAVPDDLDPAGTVSAFYQWYLAYSGEGEMGRNPLVDGAQRSTGYITGGLSERLASASDGQGGFDPLLCAQDIPEYVIPSGTEEEGGRAHVRVRTSFADHGFAVVLVRAGSAWQIDDVQCSPTGIAPTPATSSAEVVAAAAPQDAAAASPGGWQTYTNRKFGFRLGYPGGWVVRETESVQGEPPIGPEAMKLVVMLMPPEWAEQLERGGAPDPNAPVLAPYAVEVWLASEEEFWANYPESAERLEVALGHSPAVRTVEAVTDDIAIARYVFRQPEAPELWAVLMDPINGFPDRRKEYAEVGAVFEQMANAFAWQD